MRSSTSPSSMAAAWSASAPAPTSCAPGAASSPTMYSSPVGACRDSGPAAAPDGATSARSPPTHAAPDAATARLRMIPGMSEDVLFEKTDDGVGLITLNRPDSLNAMGGDLIPMLGRYLEECERSRDVRCVAVTGTGRAFCAGGDVKGMVAGQRGGGDGGDSGERP